MKVTNESISNLLWESGLQDIIHETLPFVREINWHTHGDWSDLALTRIRLLKKLGVSPYKIIETISNFRCVLCWLLHESDDQIQPNACLNCVWNGLCWHQDNATTTTLIEASMRIWYSLGWIEKATAYLWIGLARSYAQKAYEMDKIIRNRKLKPHSRGEISSSFWKITINEFQGFDEAMENLWLTGVALWESLQRRLLPVFERMKQEVLLVLEGRKALSSPVEWLEKTKISNAQTKFKLNFWNIPNEPNLLVEMN